MSQKGQTGSLNPRSQESKPSGEATVSPSNASGAPAKAAEPSPKSEAVVPVTQILDVLTMEQAIALMQYLGPKLCEVCGYKPAWKIFNQKQTCKECTPDEISTRPMNYKFNRIELKFMEKLEQFVKVFCGESPKA